MREGSLLLGEGRIGWVRKLSWRRRIGGLLRLIGGIGHRRQLLLRDIAANERLELL